MDLETENGNGNMETETWKWKHGKKNIALATVLVKNFNLILFILAWLGCYMLGRGETEFLFLHYALNCTVDFLVTGSINRNRRDNLL